MMPGAMRRLFRILMSAATVLSLVLCVGAMAAWVRSYQARDIVWWSLEHPRMQLWIGTYRGGLIAGVTTPVAGTGVPLNRKGAGWEEYAPLLNAEAGGPQRTFLNRFGFARSSVGSALRQLACPYWFIMLLTAILPAARFAGWRRRRARRLRMHANLCQHCGYDCCATPDRCPECGRVPTPAPPHPPAAPAPPPPPWPPSR